MNYNSKSKIIGLCGLIGSGKDTVADYLVSRYNYKRDSFASTLKDAVAAVFGWDREMLEGRTKEARLWREQIDKWWANRLNIPHLTPRWVLQYWGTDVLRNHFHNDIWIASIEHKFLNVDYNVVISDCRFPNEITAIRSLNGKVIRVVRGLEPSWIEDAKCFVRGPERNIGWALARKTIEEQGIHPSEYSWVDTQFDNVIDNNGSLQELYKQVDIIA